jgi:hypothetical protein
MRCTGPAFRQRASNSSAGGLYALFILLAAIHLWRRLLQRDSDAARSAGLRLTLLLALPLIAWLSLNAMQRSWN